MYNAVYAAVVESGIAIMLDEEEWANEQGNIVANKEEAFRCKTKFLLTHSLMKLEITHPKKKMATLKGKHLSLTPTNDH